MEAEPQVEQQVTEQQQTVDKAQDKPALDGIDGVYKRDEYSKAQFWEDRMKETKGFFDWYVEFDELKRYIEKTGISAESRILMVGCGNSKVSEQMYDAGYKNIVNVDIAPSIIKLMKDYHDKKEKFMEWTVMDCMNMTFEDQSFDLVIDKGTIDAVICGDDLQPSLQITREMCRITKKSGHVVLVSNAAPQGRKMLFEDSIPIKDFETHFSKVCLSDKSDLINIMRHNLKDKPMSAIMKDKTMLLKSMIEYKLSCKLRDARNKKALVMEKLEYENCKVNFRVEDWDKDGKKTQVYSTKDQEKADTESKETAPTEESTKVVESETAPTEDSTNVEAVEGQEPELKQKNYVKVNDQGYNPIRQNFCYVYLINRVDWEKRAVETKKAEIEAEEQRIADEAKTPQEIETEEQKVVENVIEEQKNVA